MIVFSIRTTKGNLIASQIFRTKANSKFFLIIWKAFPSS